MTTSYFTFGQKHTHSYNGVTLDRNIVIKITADNPRDKMFELFGDKWCFEYDKEPNMEYFPKGIFDININKFI